MKSALLIAFLFTATLPSLLAQNVINVPAPTVPDRISRSAAFLTRIRFADPDYRVILMACLKETELNLLLSRQVTDVQIPILVKGLLTQLSQALPGEDLQVIAFKPIVPLRESGIAALDHRTGQISYVNPQLGPPSPRTQSR
jgi:hypothetical protein